MSDGFGGLCARLWKGCRLTRSINACRSAGASSAASGRRRRAGEGQRGSELEVHLDAGTVDDIALGLLKHGVFGRVQKAAEAGILLRDLADARVHARGKRFIREYALDLAFIVDALARVLDGGQQGVHRYAPAAVITPRSVTPAGIASAPFTITGAMAMVSTGSPGLEVLEAIVVFRRIWIWAPAGTTDAA
jgi:hypothetical protein